MNHGVIEVFAYQETLLIMAVFAIAILAMIWVGFRRWLQYKERTDRLIADQRGAYMERVEERLNAIEQIVGNGGVRTPGQINALRTDPLTDPISKRDEV